MASADRPGCRARVGMAEPACEQGGPCPVLDTVGVDLTQRLGLQ